MIPFTPSTSHFAHVLRTRRTINLFRPAPECPPQELILQAIELARWAPNHKHTEPWRFHLLGPQTVAAMIALNTQLVAGKDGPAAAESKRNKWAAVPGWMAVTCARSDDPVRQEEDYAACCCAIQNLMLFLWSEGVGAKWSTGGVTRHADFYRLIGVDPRERRAVGLVWYGYPQGAPEARRKTVEEIVSHRP